MKNHLLCLLILIFLVLTMSANAKLLWKGNERIFTGIVESLDLGYNYYYLGFAEYYLGEKNLGGLYKIIDDGVEIKLSLANVNIKNADKYMIKNELGVKLNGTDFSYINFTLSPLQLKEYLTLYKQPSVDKWQFGINVNNGTFSVINNEVLFYNYKNDFVGKFNQPVIYDSGSYLYENENGTWYSNKKTYGLLKLKGENVLELTINMNFLKEATYPVFIDPTYDDFEDASVDLGKWKIQQQTNGCTVIETSGYLQAECIDPTDSGAGAVVNSTAGFFNLSATEINITNATFTHQISTVSHSSEINLKFPNNTNILTMISFTSVSGSNIRCELCGNSGVLDPCPFSPSVFNITIKVDNSTSPVTLNITCGKKYNTIKYVDSDFHIDLLSSASGAASEDTDVKVYQIDYRPFLHDNKAPYWTYNRTNFTTIKVNEAGLFNITFTDESTFDSGGIIDSITFSVKNSSSKNWENISTQKINTSTNDSSFKLTMSSNRSQVFQWKFYANDTLGQWNESDVFSINISNTLPIITVPSITPSPAQNSDDLICNNGTFSDADSDNQMITFYRWRGNGKLIVNDTWYLEDGNTSLNDKISCEILVYDGYDNSSDWVSNNNITIGDNIIPEIRNWITNNPTYTDEILNVTVNCTDLSSAINEVLYTIINPSNVTSNQSMILTKNNEYEDNDYSIATIGYYNISFFWCKDTSGNTNKTKVDLSFTMTSRPTTTGDGGAGGGVPREIIEFVNISFCGDGFCDESEKPLAWWSEGYCPEDCPVDVDTIITCLWKDPKSCIYSQAWFATILVYFLILITIIIAFRGVIKKE